MSLADAFVDVKPNTRGFQRDLDRQLGNVDASRAGNRVGESFSKGTGQGLRRMAGIGIKAVAGLTAAVGTGVGVLGVMGIKQAAANEQALIGFTTMLRSGTKAKAFLQDLQNFAAKTPFEFPDLQTAAQSLISVGIHADKVIPIMTSLGNATAGMGTGAEGVKRATIAIQQMSAAGRITGEDLNQLRDAGIPVFDLLSKATGKSTKAIAEMAQKGKLGKDVLDDMMRALETGKGLERFAGMMDKQSQSLGGLWSTFKDVVGQNLAKSVQPLIPMLKDGLGGASEFLAGVLPKVASGFKTVITAIRGIADLVVGGRISEHFRDAFGFGNAGAIAGSILKIRAAITSFFDDWKKGEGVAGGIQVAFGRALDTFKTVVGWLSEHKAEVFGFVTSLLAVVGAIKLIATTWAIVSAVLSISPFGAILLGISLLVAYIIHLWKTNATFRANVTKDWAYIREHWDILVANFKLSILSVKGKWAELQLAISGAKRWFRELKENIAETWQRIKDVFREGVRVVVMFFYDMVGKVLDGAVKAFGWIPGIGTKLRTAAAKFNKFKDDVNRSLSKVEDKDVTLRAKFEATKGPGGWTAGIKLGATGGEVSGGTKGKDSVPYLLMPGEFIIDRKGNNLADAMAYFGVPGMARGGRADRFRVRGATPTAGGVQRKVDTKFTQMFTAVGTRAMNALAPILAGWTSGVGGVGAGVQRWAGVVLQALQMLHQSASWLPVVLRRMQQESGGNQYAINLWDINARRGDPSRGLMQTIGSTFAAYAGSLRNRGIYDPLANIYAGLNYALHRYGSLSALTRPGGYDLGGILHPGALGLNRTNRPERVLSPDQTVLFDRLVSRLEGRASDRAASVLRLHPDDIRAIGAELRAGMAGANYASGRQAGLMARTV